MVDRAAVEPSAADAAFQWRWARALARVVPPVEDVLADHASSYCMRAVHRRELKPTVGAGLCWHIDGEVVVTVAYVGRGPARLVVHDMALMRPLRRRLRSRHVEVVYESSA